MVTRGDNGCVADDVDVVIDGLIDYDSFLSWLIYAFSLAEMFRSNGNINRSEKER